MAALQKELVSLEATKSTATTGSGTSQTKHAIAKPETGIEFPERSWDLEPESLPDETDCKETSEEEEPVSEVGFKEKMQIAASEVGAFCSKKWWRFRRRANVWTRRGVREAQASILDPSAETFQNRNAPPLLRNEKRRARNRFLALAFLFAIVIFFILKNIYSDY